MAPSVCTFAMHGKADASELKRIRRPFRTCSTFAVMERSMTLYVIAFVYVCIAPWTAAFVVNSPSTCLVSHASHHGLASHAHGLSRKKLYSVAYNPRDLRPLCGLRTLMANSASDSSQNKKNENGLTKFKEQSVRLFTKLLTNIASLVR
jgi:hypothetical protein